MRKTFTIPVFGKNFEWQITIEIQAASTFEWEAAACLRWGGIMCLVQMLMCHKVTTII